MADDQTSPSSGRRARVRTVTAGVLIVVLALAIAGYLRLHASSLPSLEGLSWSAYRPDRASEVPPPSSLPVAFDPGGRTLAVSSPDGTVRLFSTITHRLLDTFHSDLSKATDTSRGGSGVVAFSPDGRLLAIGGSAEEPASYVGHVPESDLGLLPTQVWDIHTHKILATAWPTVVTSPYDGNAGAGVDALVFSREADSLTIQGADGVTVWDLRHNTKRSVTPGPERQCGRTEPSPMPGMYGCDPTSTAFLDRVALWDHGTLRDLAWVDPNGTEEAHGLAPAAG